MSTLSEPQPEQVRPSDVLIIGARITPEVVVTHSAGEVVGMLTRAVKRAQMVVDGELPHVADRAPREDHPPRFAGTGIPGECIHGFAGPHEAPNMLSAPCPGPDQPKEQR